MAEPRRRSPVVDAFLLGALVGAAAWVLTLASAHVLWEYLTGEPPVGDRIVPTGTFGVAWAFVAGVVNSFRGLGREDR